MKTWIIYASICLFAFSSCSKPFRQQHNPTDREFNGSYTGEHLNRIAFPMGGMGAGMICLEGNGSFSHVSVRNKPDVFNSPFFFSALAIKGDNPNALILEGPVQSWKIFGNPETGNGASIFGCPRFENAMFQARFPFGTVSLTDADMPLDVTITGWSPFIPGDPDNSSMPVGAVEYTFKNTSRNPVEAVYSFHSENFMRVEIPSEWGGQFVGKDSIATMDNGFILAQPCFPDKPHYKGDFAVFTDEPGAVVDYCWFRGGWFDSRTMLWKNIESCATPSNPVSTGSPGASIYVPFTVQPGESRTVRLFLSWFVPHSDLRQGAETKNDKPAITSTASVCLPGSSCCPPEIAARYYEPWYSARFTDIKQVTKYWSTHYSELKHKTSQFTDAFFSSTLPPEVLEAVSANLSILKSPTVLRQKDGKLWAWEGCHDGSGCCYGSCTHVWNYAQAIPNLFPSLERTLRETEFLVSQNAEGHQTFRSSLPVREPNHDWFAAADGQLGGIMKVYREWRISGDKEWLQKLWPQVKSSMDFCINHWDPRHTGTIEEPHHNTYDIEFWGPDAMCTSFYLGALEAFIKLSEAMGDDTVNYAVLLEAGKKAMQTSLYNGEYFMQRVKWEGLSASDPIEAAKQGIGTTYSDEALEIFKKEGPKYQYGNGCLSDGVLGFWIAQMCGVGEIIDHEKVQSHLLSVYKYNLKTDLSGHVNPQRSAYAYGNEGGLILCSWPKGGQPALPFVYSNEVWTGIEYQVASYLMMEDRVKEGLEIVKTCRKRYDGKIRDPFDEYECGHWYARAMSSYGLLQGLTGLRYDAVDKALYMDSKIGNDFSCFISTDTGFGVAGMKNGKPFLDIRCGDILVKTAYVTGKPVPIKINKPLT